ncbi:YciI family protein [Microbacterium sp. G2-8]|uniref:YciI family protein n=1 Tax=Microbacterium sp. G2-8 TaxID=2842454 RepID=UPI001C890175|nr:YciI family protein [Microbacterium sp. G2-8]
MKVMLIMRATDAAVEAYKEIPFEQVIENMGRFNEELMKAGVLLAGEGLAEPDDNAFVVDFTSEPPLVTDGPYGETKELFSGFWILEVASKEEAVRWASKVPLGPGAKIEVRRVTDASDFDPDNEWIQKEEGWREEQAQRAEK